MSIVMNELLLLLTAVVSAVFVFTAWRFGKERLYSAIIVFLILIASLGGKIVIFAGHPTNTGNVFYASVFLATYFLIERYGRREGIRSIWIGVVWVVFFSFLVQLTIHLVSAPGSEGLSNALTVAFSPVPRIAFASLLAYASSQTLNVYLYILLKEKMDGKHLWLRANASNLAAQILDSIIFFTVAFAGVTLPTNLGDLILTGLTIKILYMACASPLLYFNFVEEDGGPKTSTVVFRYDR
jgi:uncharacterized integral membrane protein (TIGR00697 family)